MEAGSVVTGEPTIIAKEKVEESLANTSGIPVSKQVSIALVQSSPPLPLPAELLPFWAPCLSNLIF